MWRLTISEQTVMNHGSVSRDGAYLYCIDPCCDTACKIIGKEPEEE